MIYVFVLDNKYLFFNLMFILLDFQTESCSLLHFVENV